GNLANLVEFEGQPGYRFVHGDICDADLVNALAAEADAIVNFAAETHVDRSLMDPFAFIETDVRGTAVLCEAARKHGHEVFLLVSTDEVYGDVSAGRSRETDPMRPRSPYSASKAGDEPEDPTRRLLGEQGRRRAPGSGLRGELRPAAVDHARLQQLRAVSVPGE